MPDGFQVNASTVEIGECTDAGASIIDIELLATLVCSIVAKAWLDRIDTEIWRKACGGRKRSGVVITTEDHDAGRAYGRRQHRHEAGRAVNELGLRHERSERAELELATIESHIEIDLFSRQ